MAAPSNKGAGEAAGRKGGKYILRASFVDKNGQKHYARDHGKRAFRIWVSR